MATTKILQCVYSMNYGGVESWLMHVLRNIDRTRYQVDFATFSAVGGAYDNEIQQLGSRIFRCSPLARPWMHGPELRSIFQKFGPYDAVHSHGTIFNGVVLSTAKRCGIPIRIVHGHNDIRQSLPVGSAKRIFAKWSIQKSKENATHGLTCSRFAASSLFGNNWESDPRWRVFYCGEDFSPFASDVQSPALRRSLNLPEDALVIGHVGSFRNQQKNQRYLIEIARELAKEGQEVCWLLVGDGILRHAIESYAARLGLGGRIVFTGERPDVPELMVGAMDLFCFPSLYEGLGLALVEAQAAGLPCICSTAIPEEADVIPDLITRVPLTAAPSVWARAINGARNAIGLVPRDEALAQVNNGPFNLANGIAMLASLYSGQIP